EQMKKMMEMNSEYLQSMIKPLSVSLVISMLLLILFFPWLRAVYSGKVVLTIPASLPVIGGKALTWTWWYMICSLGVGLTLRKILKI
ncbi:MAG: EMC3/TMCO1 family protein, partial [Candidatus Heimdallarchaeaceae archaeon]